MMFMSMNVIFARAIKTFVIVRIIILGKYSIILSIKY